MTEASRIQHIQKALAVHAGSKEPERSPFPLSRGRTMLPIVTIPVTVPLLNAKSFRIAPALRDHPQADLVKADPDSPAAQKIVADLVRQRHSHAEDLKESLRDEGQAEPGVITRSGVLINANTRCVLMRELLGEGQLRENSMRVAVLPEDVDPAELYDLEAVLQQQQNRPLGEPEDIGGAGLVVHDRLHLGVASLQRTVLLLRATGPAAAAFRDDGQGARSPGAEPRQHAPGLSLDRRC